MGSIVKIVGGVTSNIAPLVSQALPGIQGELFSGIVAAAEKSDQRALFSGILLATVERVNKKPNFNLELEINDLNIKLGNIRGVGPMASVASVLGDIGSLQTSLGSAMNAIVRNLK